MKKTGTFLLIGIFLIIGLKSCIVTVISIDDYILVEKSDEYGQQDRVILTPQNEMIYVKKYQDIVEIGIYKLKGQEATHYLFGLYCIGTFPFGLRYYNNADKVFDSELTLVKKQGDSFPIIGDSFNSKIVIFKNKAIIGKSTFKRIILNEKKKEDLILSIDQLKSAIN